MAGGAQEGCVQVATSGRARKDLIITVATDLFMRKGYQETGIDEIGAAAKISGPAIYRHFANKQEILVGCFDGLLAASRHDMDRINAVEGSAADKIEFFLRQLISGTIGARSTLAFLSRESRQLTRSQRQRVLDEYQRIVDEMASILSETSPRTTHAQAVTIIVTLTGMVQRAVFSPAWINSPDSDRLLLEMARGALSAVV